MESYRHDARFKTLLQSLVAYDGNYFQWCFMALVSELLNNHAIDADWEADDVIAAYMERLAAGQPVILPFANPAMGSKCADGSSLDPTEAEMSTWIKQDCQLYPSFQITLRNSTLHIITGISHAPVKEVDRCGITLTEAVAHFSPGTCGCYERAMLAFLEAEGKVV